MPRANPSPPPSFPVRFASSSRKRRMSPFWISLVVHAVLLGGGWFLFASAKSEPKPLSFARVEIIEPRAEDGAPAEEKPVAEETEEDAVDCAPDALDTFETVQPDLENLELPEDPDVPFSDPVDSHDLPLEVVKVRPREPRGTQPAPPATPAPTVRPPPPRRPVAARPAARPARGKPLRLVSRPTVMRYYPPEAQRRGWEGTAHVEIRVDRRGVVVSAKVVRSSGYEILDQQALKVMYAHRFAPGDGGRARVPVSFTLR